MSNITDPLWDVHGIENLAEVYRNSNEQPLRIYPGNIRNRRDPIHSHGAGTEYLSKKY